MANIRYRIEKWFERYAHAIYRNRIKTMIIMLLFTALFVSQTPKITMDGLPPVLVPPVKLDSGIYFPYQM